MAVDHVKSTAITNWDATPAVANLAGVGSGAIARWADSGPVTAVASSSADSTYQMVRLPPNAIVKMVWFESEAQGAGKFDIGVYRQDLASYVAANATDQDFFATVIDCASAVVITEITNESGTNTPAKRQQPLWQAVGLSSNPGCPLDIVATVKTTAVTTGTGKLNVGVLYVM